jgi:hypothetical protein
MLRLFQSIFANESDETGPCSGLPPPVDFIAEAARYIG